MSERPLVVTHADRDEIQRRIEEAVSPPGDDDRTRQELAPETDLNVLLARYQPWELPNREAFYGERDYDLDPHDAIIANRAALERYRDWERDPELRKHFRSFGDFLRQYEAVLDSPAESGAAVQAPDGGGTRQPSASEGGSGEGGAAAADPAKV